jgi:hypothetical protein
MYAIVTFFFRSSITQLPDKLLEAPVSQYAASHSAPPDEEHDLAERMYEEADRRWEAQQRFDSLLRSKYLN